MNDFADRGRPAPLVMVVDDNPANVQLLGQLLDGAGYNVVPATSGTQALERAASRQPDLVLLDMVMPGMDGYEVLRRLQQLPGLADLPVIFVTASDSLEDLARGFDLGAVDYVTKPFVAKELLARVRTHVELKRSRDHLQMVLRERDEIVNIVAHDLKNPLTCIRFANQLLMRNKDESRRLELMQEIEDCSEEALEFVQRFLTQRAEGEALRQLHSEPVDLRELAAQALRLQQAAAEVRGLRLRLEAAEPEVTALGDRMAARNVLQNLLSNAIRHSPEGEEVLVSLELTRVGGARCLVLDRGPGISEADQKKLFQRFARIVTAKATPEYSTGLGLAIAKHDITRMGGHLWYESRPGGGSVFGFELPQQRVA
ncbi:hybrid sensor histidine kinase/response regulator [Solimonas sp. K1W22B-7]|uniref:hybrid sensor histidine kinase/response regulator n=1 Tax=Solimonas sp. K1W22B-7 TaxID=2303331 RepID=UPI000E32E60F|nr:hybrid sensor histidine kinase/response regulator [Solimonas sp. K1W22B-7]AXQ27371.1 hybrid sensor histidine kinase/response regulator [Solimonas sp. K1W22B-7]